MFTTLLYRNFLQKLQIKLFFVLFVISFSAIAQKDVTYPSKPFSELKVDGWDTETNLPTASLTDIYQTQNGYLWLSSYSGLIRFDGVKFTIYDKKKINFLQSPTINAVAEDENHTLWLVSNGSGLLAYQKDVFSYFGQNTEIKNFNILNILIDKNKKHIWLGTRNHGVWIFDRHTQQFSIFKAIPHITNTTITSLLQEPDGKIWIGTEGKGLFSFDKDRFEAYSIFNGKIAAKFIYSLLYDKEKNIWVGTANGLFKQVNKKFVEIAELSGLEISCLLEDKKQNIWIGSNNGIFRKNRELGIYESLEQTEMFSKIHAYGFCEDHEGSIWASLYNAGLLRLKESNFANFSRQDGIASKAVDAVVEIGKNDFLIGTDVGIVNRIKDGKVSVFPIQTPLKNERIRYLYQDQKAAIWVATYKGLLKILPNGTEKLYTTADSLADTQTRAVHENRQTGDIWIGTKAGGITILGKNKIIQLNKNTGLASDFIMSIEETTDGNMVIATNDGGLSIADKYGKIIAHYSMQNGLNSNLIFSTYTDLENRTWVVTSAGISLLQDGKIRNIDSEKIGLTDSPFDLLEDNYDNFWIPTRKGIIRVVKSEFLDWIEGKIPKIHYRIFDQSDGMKSAACTGGVAAYQDSKGNLWFPTIDGISKINPANIRLNEVPPPVVIESFETDSMNISLASKDIILKNVNRITLHFTATSLIAPEDITFRYRLLGYDQLWHEGQERQISYTNLPIGNYEFQVTACNNDEVWNPSLTKIAFTIQAKYYQTVWFYVLVMLMCLSLFYLIYKIRLHQISQKNMELARLVTERTTEISLKKEEIEAQANAIHTQKLDLEKAYQRIQTLSAIGQKITTQLNLTELVKTVYDYLHLMMPAEGFGIGIYNKEMHRMEFTGYIENNIALPFHYYAMKEKQRLAIRCFLKQEEIIINDYAVFAKEEQLHNVIDIGEIPNSIIYLPLSFENKPVGVITVQSFSNNAYQENEVTLLKSLVSYIAIAIDNAHAYDIIADKNQKITDSIHYAQHIQAAMLPPIHDFDEYFGFRNSFVLFKPKDIVSGDFYWLAQEDRYTVVAVVDCTGHGVPGAFMSMLGSSFLNDLVIAEGFKNPSVILKRMDKKINQFFNHRNNNKENKVLDGMDMSILVLHKDLKNNIFTKAVYAGAMNSLYYLQDGRGIEIKATKKPIGGSQFMVDSEFQNHEINLLNKKTYFYLFSDGYADQFGEKENKKFRTKHFREGLFSINQLDMYEQKEVLLSSLSTWQGREEQTDDITVVGILIDNTKNSEV